MERGTEWERSAVRERWAAMERKQALATRLLGGLCLVGAGVVLLLLGVAREVCFVTARGGVIDCTPMTRPFVSGLLVLLGVVVLSWGFWNCWPVFRD
ncbi:hypothetical protein [Halorussus halophilus]|uniref:hypothetical protein n=1 Tax=Halorussus halophilus TaxID=2650975 RepID=UPI001301928B|nr:hypothetical protein [Halorussus halophilus]